LFVLGRKALGWDRYEELCDSIGLLGGPLRRRGSRLGLHSRRISYGAKNGKHGWGVESRTWSDSGSGLGEADREEQGESEISWGDDSRDEDIVAIGRGRGRKVGQV